MNVDEFLARPVNEISTLIGLAIGFIAAVILLICLLLIVIKIVLDALNIKKISLVPFCIEFYKDGDEKKSRVTGRRKIVQRRTRK